MDLARDPKTFATRFELDYFQRARPMRRWKWILSFAVLIACAAFVATLVAAPQFHSAFQTAPVSHSHAAFGQNCTVCHDQPFGTISRFIPSSRFGTVSDSKCLACHNAGRHDAHQLRNSGPNGRASGCIECHKEHRGEVLNRLPDMACTSCHADLKTDDGTHRYHANIRHFSDGHPQFGAWRKGPLRDPAGGKFFFNHKRHLELANELKDISKASRPLLAAEAEKLRRQECAYCHQPDADMKRMQPIRYDDHCAACHPLTLKAVPADQWPAEASAEFAKPVAHPGQGENATKVRAEILQRYISLGSDAQLSEPRMAAEPPILRNDDDLKALQERERFAVDRTRLTQAQLFDHPGTGCGLCHKEVGRKHGLPEYAYPHQQRGRWRDEIANWPAAWLRHPTYADDANRWHPLASFDHSVHRTYACNDCHPAATSSKAEDVLIPGIDNCKQCHNRSATSAHADCLTCHTYHDRSQEQPTRLETPPTLKALLQRAKE